MTDSVFPQRRLRREDPNQRAGWWLFAVATLAACGGDGAGGHNVDGAFARLTGARITTFTLAAGGALQVLCRPKPGLKELEYEAAQVLGTDSGSYLRFTLKDYVGPQDYSFEHDVAKAQHKIEVGVPAAPRGADGKDHKYKFFEYLRPDLNVVHRSRCDATIAAEELSSKTRLSGTLACTMLFADFKSKDYDSTGQLNAFVDLWAKFECDY
jgi:hypothetical protein